MTITASPLAESVAEAAKQPQDTAKAAPVRRRRSPFWAAGSALLILLCVVAGYFLYTGASNATPVFVASTDIPRGSVIDKEDLTTISIAADQTTAAIPATKPDELIGTIASVDIPSGALITKNSTTSELNIPEGKSLVGLTLKPGQLPAQKLKAGDSVVIVPVQLPGAPALEITPEQTIPGVVSQVTSLANTSDVIVDIYVPAQAAPSVASRSGSLAVVLASAGGKR